MRAATETFDVLDLDGFEFAVPDRSVDDWLEIIWGIRLGQSSPVGLPIADSLEAGIATWLHGLWGLAALPR
jgi:hypothetical protein